MLADPLIRRWTIDEYYRIAGAEMFDDCHVELIEGMVVETGPMNSSRATGVSKTLRAVFRVFRESAVIRPQLPFRISAEFVSETEPDLAVVTGNPGDYKDAHPTTAMLVIEVAESSLEHDRTTKSHLYAQAGVEDYWIVNLADRQLEVHRNPVGEAYADVTILRESDSVAPLAAPQATIAVAELLP